MGCVSLGGDSLHNNGHEAMQGAAQLGALTVEYTFTLDECVDSVDTTGDAIGLHT
eukprot:CAMPEP_0206483052 /NCGR_PEP_ID=MMETSP0324_2-20121206/39205_1 /ASSEMBLY_ACC=CAM_ASM_000836 /TAXON_ID=2866 /ORGANISM="Crypthecodinium cohnii, Strain Seligo" /LENGTH=54 /DNA_ID=CAMNT_0053961047 /DNA_START=126 /DNA_END=290 /DNA_ORIENTATION=+